MAPYDHLWRHNAAASWLAGAGRNVMIAEYCGLSFRHRVLHIDGTIDCSDVGVAGADRCKLKSVRCRNGSWRRVVRC
jgi:hypothetical protein